MLWKQALPCAEKIPKESSINHPEDVHSPWKINHWTILPWRFGSDHFPLNKMGDGCRFQPLIFQGVVGWVSTHLKRLFLKLDHFFQGSGMKIQKCFSKKTPASVIPEKHHLTSSSPRCLSNISSSPRCLSIYIYVYISISKMSLPWPKISPFLFLIKLQKIHPPTGIQDHLQVGRPVLGWGNSSGKTGAPWSTSKLLPRRLQKPLINSCLWLGIDINGAVKRQVEGDLFPHLAGPVFSWVDYIWSKCNKLIKEGFCVVWMVGGVMHYGIHVIYNQTV